MFCITCLAAIFLIPLCAFAIHKLFKELRHAMELHELCLLEFKESPMSRRVRENLPKMDIITETNEDEDNEDKNSNFTAFLKL